MIKIKQTKEYEAYFAKRRIILLSSTFCSNLKHEQYKLVHSIVTEDKNLSMTVILMYLVKKGRYIETLSCIRDYHLVRRFKDKQWIPSVAVLRFIKYEKELQMVKLPTIQKIYAIYLILQMMKKRPDFTATLAIAKFLKVSSSKIKHIHRILGGN